MDLSTGLSVASTLAIVGGVVFAGWQLRISAQQRTTEASLQLLQSLRSQEFVDGIMALYALPEGLSSAEVQERLGDKWGNAMLALMNVDALGLLVYRGEIDAKLADDFFKTTVAVVWSRLKPVAQSVRKEVGFETALEWAQWLAEEQAKIRAVPRKPIYAEG